MAGGEAVGAEVAGEAEQVGELDALVAATRRGSACGPRAYSSAKRSITLVAEAALIVEDIMGDAEPVGDGARIVDVAAGAAALRPPDRLAMIVKLERDADHLGAAARGERGHDRAVDAARHGDDDPGLRRRAVELEIGVHGGAHRRRISRGLSNAQLAAFGTGAPHPACWPLTAS